MPRLPHGNWPKCSRISKAGIATCSRYSRRAPSKWKRRWRRTPFSTRRRRCLIGAYFLHEYSFEASALFNPSIVPHPDQSGAPEGGCRFILSLRAVGEGHISSLTFRSGSIAADGSVTVDPTARLACGAENTQPDSRSDGDDVEVTFRDDRRTQRTGHLSGHRCPVNGIEDARFVEFTTTTEQDVLRDLYRLQRTGDPLRAARNEGFHVVPDDATRRAPRRATRAWRCSRARSTAATR